MALTRDYRQTVRERAQRDPDFAASLMNEAISSFLGGDSETSRLVLRDLVNSTIGFELLARKLHKPSKSVHRMLSLKGNPTMDNLTHILLILQDRLECSFEVILSAQPKERCRPRQQELPERPAPAHSD